MYKRQYQNQASLGLVHQPEVEMWTFSALSYDGQTVRHVGLNFGAPGDRRGPDGTLWMDVPSVGGSSPDLRLAVLAEDADYVRHHTSRIEGGEYPWVGASSLRADSELIMTLVPPGDFDVANEVAGMPPLSVKNATTSLIAPGTVRASGSVDTSLRKGSRAGKLEARIEAHEAFAAESLTVEFWAHVDADVIYVDATAGGEQEEQGFVIDNRKLRVRYFVANEAGDNNEKGGTIETKDAIGDRKWAHLAFSYDAASGVGHLYVDGKSEGTHDGPDGRRLWWDVAKPHLQVGKNVESANVSFDDLRVTRGALAAEHLLTGSAALEDAGRVIGYWRMRPAMDAGSLPGLEYTVRLIFAETEGAAPGERLFDVSIQGETVLEGFDIAATAGGGNRTIVREVPGVRVKDHLRIGLKGRGGRPPLLAGVQILSAGALESSGD